MFNPMFRVAYQYVGGLANDSTPETEFNAANAANFIYGVIGTSHWMEGSLGIASINSYPPFEWGGETTGISRTAFENTFYFGGGSSRTVESDYFYLKATIVDAVSDIRLISSFSGGSISEHIVRNYADNINDPTITRTETGTIAHVGYQWVSYPPGYPADIQDANNDGYDDRGEHDTNPPPPEKPLLFDATANSRDLDALNPDDYRGSFTDAGDGNDTVILPGDGGGVIKWGLQGGFSGGAGDDAILAGSIGIPLHGDAGNDTLYGGTGEDQIDGGAGNDILYGSEDADDHAGDVLTGGTGADIFHVGSGDTVTDFEIGEAILAFKPDGAISFLASPPRQTGDSFYYDIQFLKIVDQKPVVASTFKVQSSEALYFSFHDEGQFVRVLPSHEPPLPPNITLPSLPEPYKIDAVTEHVFKSLSGSSDLLEEVEDAVNQFGLFAKNLKQEELIREVERFGTHLNAVGRILGPFGKVVEIGEMLDAVVKAPDPYKEFAAQAIAFIAGAVALSVGTVAGTGIFGVLIPGIGALPGAFIGAAAANILYETYGKEKVLEEVRERYDHSFPPHEKISNLIHSPSSDGAFHGTASNDLIVGIHEQQRFVGSEGSDNYIAVGDGNTVDLSPIHSGINVDLATGRGVHASLSSGPPLLLAAKAVALPDAPAMDHLTFHGIANLTGTDFNDNLAGDGNANELQGGAGNDNLTGRGGDDHLVGGDGNDKLDGGTGDDVMEGGAGNDTYLVDSSGDRVIEQEGGGIDTVRTTLPGYTLGDNVEKLVFTGSGDFTGTGNALDNLLSGGSGNDILSGLGGKDNLIGGDGNDTLIGGGGSDNLTGGAGRDSFVFDSLSVSADRDTIKDFVSGEDRIAIDRAVFTAFASQSSGTIDASEFTVGKLATTVGQHLIYDDIKGALYYDADGAGGKAQIQIATLTGHPTLSAADLFLL